MEIHQLCEVCGENRAVFAFQKAGVPTRHICTSCHQESLPEPARSFMKAMESGPCRYCGKPGHAVAATKGMLFHFPFEEDHLCGTCQMDFTRAMGERAMQLKTANANMGEKELFKVLEDAGRQVDLEMKGG